jgi:colicin import membrane protein
MTGFLREHSGPVALSVLLHGSLAAALLLATRFSIDHSPAGLQPLPINAVVVDSQVLHAAERANAAAEQARAAAAALAAADARAAADAHSAAEAQAAADAHAAELVRTAEQVRAAAQAYAVEQAHAAEIARAADQARASAQAHATAAQHQRAADAASAAASAAALVRAAAARQAAEAKNAADAKRAADARQATAKLAAEQRARTDREAELRRQLAEEEHVSAVEAGPLADRYRASLVNRITQAWLKPPSARLGIDCRVEVTQIPGGEVISARVMQCNGDAAVRQSIENAVYRASPLPDPADMALFQRVFVFEFKPNE